MIRTLLVANRGEIARRIFRTCRRLGIATVAVYSEADRDAPFVGEADRAIAIGNAQARESYLDISRVLAAARESGADAIHPGYGFLSENAEFAEAVQAAGIVWVGPPAAAIRAMGRKDAAKALMMAAGVPTTPGYFGDDQSDDRLRAEAGRIGFPVLIKAVAGGGGKGMRRVASASEMAASLAACRREAEAAFGDARVLLETHVAHPRHIEVQVFADRHGNVVHLFERDCSLQRRHQKVIEEAPAPGMTAPVREAVTAAAIAAARAVGYEGAGTVEFIADASEGLRHDRIWFMEMNTRLQVEHPVTEAVTGQDLVEWQLRVAAGEPLACRQEALRLEGCAVEARLYAENPATGFLPSVGRLSHLALPADGIRVDSAVEAGSEITSFYDPMIAKLIAHAPTRREAAARLAAACAAIEVFPVHTNAGFLARTLAHTDFIEGRVDTGFIERNHDSLAARPAPSRAALEAAARRRLRVPPGLPGGFRMNAPARREVAIVHAGETHIVTVAEAEPRRAPRAIEDADGRIVVFEGGEAHVFDDAGAVRGSAAETSGDGQVVAPMPGRVVALPCALGDMVERGAVLVVLEAMKMEMSLLAPFAGRVAELAVRLGAQVTEGMTLARIEHPESGG